MDEQLNNFIPLSIVRNDQHINISEYTTKFKRDVQGTADCDCPNSLSDMTTWKDLHPGRTKKKLIKIRKKIWRIAKLTI